MEIITGKYTIKEIFKDHWGEYLEKHPRTPAYIRNEVEKMLNCRNPEKGGYTKYACPDHPGEYLVIPHSCKSRFCNACGVLQTDIWINNAIGDFPETRYCHFTFTIPDYLWYLFRPFEKRFLLGSLFKAAVETVLSWFRKRGLIPAIALILHTFGKDLKFNTHIHMIITMAGLAFDKKGKPEWKEINFLPEKMLKIKWKTILLKMLSGYISSSLRQFLFKINWYVHLGIRLINPLVTCKYIGRYTKRPVMAESRIVGYDRNTVTFFYEDKSEGWKKKEYIQVSWEEFITRLIQHIPQKQFKMIRYYGILANPVRKRYQEIVFNCLKQTKKIASFWLRWRERQIKFRKVDPLICSVCGKEMILKELAFPSSLTGRLWIKTF